jgi:hypothetical protein
VLSTSLINKDNQCKFQSWFSGTSIGRFIHDIPLAKRASSHYAPWRCRSPDAAHQVSQPSPPHNRALTTYQIAGASAYGCLGSVSIRPMHLVVNANVASMVTTRRPSIMPQTRLSHTPSDFQGHRPERCRPGADSKALSFPLPRHCDVVLSLSV